MKICARCDKAIRPGEEYDTTVVHGNSVGQPTVIRHRDCPSRRRRARR
ncbi:hypothetical protein ACFXIY_10830 [Streptomyces albidoflavus]